MLMIHGYQVYLLSCLITSLSNNDQIITSYSKHASVIGLLAFTVQRLGHQTLRQSKLFNEGPSEKNVYRRIGLGQKTVQSGNRIVNWLLYSEIASTYMHEM
jgi:hypothetical protein